MNMLWPVTTLLFALLCGPAVAGSKQVHVYQLSQQYWDVRRGDSLSFIAATLLPAAPRQQQALMRDILELNPDAFIGGNPNRLRANTRLWLPNFVQTPVRTRADRDSRVERYSWGSIKRID